jgi:UDP-N-acetylglucosamine 2-epimerase (non-hydrolysing)
MPRSEMSQEETTLLGVPCVTAQDTTERPATVDHGTNVLAGTDPGRILSVARAVLLAGTRPARVPDLWDGQAAPRIVRILETQLGGSSN